MGKETKELMDFLREKARAIRKQIVVMSARAKAAHLGTALSMIDILTVLYFKILKVDPANPLASGRDRLILSKGHGGSGLYATLAERGFFPIQKLDEYYGDGTPFTGHPMRHCLPGVEATTGSLGHGLSLGAGMALAGKKDGASYRVFVLLSDGECDEGSTWEAILAAGHWKLNNLVAVVDYNKIQSYGRVSEVMELEPFADKWRAFGWAVQEVDGHDIPSLIEAFRSIPMEPLKPNVIIAHTIKGKGVSFMEDRLEWHYRSPAPEELALALKELETL